MAILERGEVVGCGNRKIVFYLQTNDVESFRSGRLVDPVTLAFAVYDVSDDNKAIDPAVVVARTSINLADCPTGGRIGLGRFVPAFTLPATASIGRHEVRWYYTRVAGGEEFAEVAYFDVVGSLGAFLPGPIYATPSDLKAEGVTGKTDAFLIQRLGLASRYIERVTGRFFEPRYMQLNLDGNGSRRVNLDVPIVAIEQVLWETSPYLPSSYVVDDDLLRVYSRHLSQGLTMPDDRNAPRIELYQTSEEVQYRAAFHYAALVFPRGSQNVIVKGVFGYTERDGTQCGATPELIRHACKLLVMREIEKLSDTAAREETRNRYRLTGERTREQAVTYSPMVSTAGSGGGGIGAFTGDSEIDTILAAFVRPPMLGAV